MTQLKFVRIAALAAGLSLCAVAPAQAQAQVSDLTDRNAASQAQSRDAEQNARQRRICVRAEVTTGSRLSGRPICKTQAEWEREGGIPRD